MRRFGNTGAEYFEFQLEGSKKTYRIPVAASMPYSVLSKLRSATSDEAFPVQVEMLRKYMGDVVDELSVGVLSDILRAWSAESKDAGADVGES